MSVEFVVCPACKQRLGIINYVTVGTEVVCANCETNLRISKRNPLEVKKIEIKDTFNADDRPESYG